MEQRKLVAFGTSSHIISIPKQWIEKNRLSKGDILNIEERNNELILSTHDTEERRQPKEATIDIEGKSIAQLKTEITAAYLNNFGVITIKGNRNENSQKIKEILQGLVGIEVVEETLSKIVVKDLLDIKEVSVDNLIRRVNLIIRSMLEDLAKMNKDAYSSLVERDKEINRMVLLGARVVRAACDNPRVAKIFQLPYSDLFISRTVLNNLERFADEIKRIARNYGKKDKQIRELIDAVTKEFEGAMKIYYSRDKNAAYRQGTEIKKFFAMCDSILEKNNTAECAKLIEHFKYMMGNVTVIIRSAMEREG